MSEVVVAQGGENDHRTISCAAAAAQPGGRIRIRPGTCDEQVRIDRDVDLVAGGPRGSIRIIAPAACLSVARGRVAATGIVF